MSRSYPKSSRVGKSTGSRGQGKRGRPRRIEAQAVAAAREVQLPLNVEALVEMTREALSSFAVETRRVKRWRDSDMRERWCVAGLLDAERRFNRIQGYKYMPQLLAALDRLHAPTILDNQRKHA